MTPKWLGLRLQEGLALGAEGTLTIPDPLLAEPGLSCLWLRDQRKLQGQGGPGPHFTDGETEVQRPYSQLVAVPGP